MQFIKEIINFIKENEIESIALCYQNSAIKANNDFSDENNKVYENYIIIPAKSLVNSFAKLQSNSTFLKMGNNFIFNIKVNSLSCIATESNGDSLELNNILLQRSFVNPFFSRKTLMLLTNDYSRVNNISFTIVNNSKEEDNNSFQDYINELISVLGQVGVIVNYTHVINSKKQNICNFDCAQNNTYPYDDIRKFTYIANTLAQIFNKNISIKVSKT